jgi:hypothetical protein
LGFGKAAEQYGGEDERDGDYKEEGDVNYKSQNSNNKQITMTEIVRASLGLPPFGRVPGLGFRNKDFKSSKKQRFFPVGAAFQPRT